MRKCPLFICLVLSLLTCFSLPCLAIEEEQLFSDFFASLPPEVADALDEVTDAETASHLVGAEYLVSLVLDSLQRELAESASYFFRLLGIALLLAVTTRLHDALGEGIATRAAECGIGFLLVLLLYRFTVADIARAAKVIEDMRAFSDGLIPIFASLFLSGGSTGTATAAAGGFAAISYLLEHVAAGVLLPLLRILFGFTLITAAARRQSLGGIFSSIKQVYLTCLGFLSLLLGASLGFQSTLAASADSLAAHSVRFAVGNLIPVVGSSLGGTLRTLSASLSLLKSTIGAVAVVALLLLILPTLIGLLLHRLFLSLAASVSTMLGSESAGKIFTDFRAIYDLAAATLAITTVLFLLIIGILTRCGLAIGGG
ncbi:MAG: hypothetical protein IJY20_03795 [Clostridia bacterium]|nr:hypothetical protein [Clostridia bacterium]